MYRLIGLAILFLAAGCASMGPDKVVEDRFDYSNAIGTSFKEQVLLNIVKLRYMDAPVILEVSSIISAYTLLGTAVVGGQVVSGGPDTLLPGVTGTYSQTPTITYNQVTGQDFVEMVLTPVSPAAFVYLIGGNWRADHVFLTLIDEINGYSNQSRVLAGAPDREFIRLAELFLALQKASAVAILHDRTENLDEFAIKLVNSRNDPAVQETIGEFQSILKLDPQADSYIVTFGYVAPDNKTIAMKTRSTMQIMTEFASFVPVREGDLSGGSITEYVEGSETGYVPVRIQSGSSRPGGEFFAAVRYNNNWYWIDQTDYETKRSFHVLMMLFSISGSGEDPNKPVITVPTR